MKTETEIKATAWFKLTVNNCSIGANEVRQRTQQHYISARSETEARDVAPQVLSYLWGKDTTVGECYRWI